MIDECRDDMFTDISTYINNYNANAYSWHTCSAYYTWYYNDIDCQVTLSFPWCNGADKCCGVSCSTSTFESYLNLYKPWYRDYLPSYWAANQEYMDDEFQNALCVNSATWDYSDWESYWFCD